MSADELAFARTHLARLASQPVSFPDDFVTPQADKPRKPATVDVGPPPLASPSCCPAWPPWPGWSLQQEPLG